MHVDVVILGGGPAGSSAAISLLKKNYTVAVIERSCYSDLRIGETVPSKAVVLLEALGIDNKTFEHQLPSFANCSAWGSSSLQRKNFLFNPFGNGWHLDRVKFDKQLIDHAEKSGACVFVNSNLIKILQVNPENWNITFSTGDEVKEISSHFLIDATGRNSILVKKQGGKRIIVDHLIGIVSFQKSCLKKEQSNYTLVESVKDGWWYSADLPKNKAVITFMTDADLYKKENRFLSEYWKGKLSETIFTRKRFTPSDGNKFFIYAANSYLMTKTFGHNWLAIGDAAMTYDPLSSAGILKALKDGVSASEAIHDFFSGKENAIEQMAGSFEMRFIKYLYQKKQYYRIEKRWEDSFFWKRRHFAIPQEYE